MSGTKPGEPPKQTTVYPFDLLPSQYGPPPDEPPNQDGMGHAPKSLGPAFVECEVRHSLPFGHHTFFVGEVVDCGFQRDEDTEVLRMEDTRMNYGG